MMLQSLPQDVAAAFLSAVQTNVHRVRSEQEAFKEFPDISGLNRDDSVALDSRSSIFRVDGLNEEGIWAIADEIVDDEPERKPYPARADILSGTIFDSGLTLEPDFSEQLRDFNICGWPSEKERRKAVDLDLCSAALLRIR